MNADAYAATGQGFVGNNMFAYCLNNPVNLVDFCGYAAAGAFRINRRSEKSSPDFFNKLSYTVEDKLVEIIYNDDESVVLKSNDFSFYKGVPVVRFPKGDLNSFSIGGVIYLEEEVSENTLRHEYGHSLQEKEMGTGLYIVAVAMPSITYNIMSRNNDTLYMNYYNMPWEYDADRRGRVHGRNGYYAEWAQRVSDIYFSYWGM